MWTLLFSLVAHGSALAQDLPRQLCKDSAAFKRANDAEKAAPACFRITEEGNLLVFSTSKRMVHASLSDATKGGVVCRQPDGSKISYSFTLNRSNRLLTLTSKSGLNLAFEYDSAGKCFDVTGAQTAKAGGRPALPEDNPPRRYNEFPFAEEPR